MFKNIGSKSQYRNLLVSALSNTPLHEKKLSFPPKYTISADEFLKSAPKVIDKNFAFPSVTTIVHFTNDLLPLPTDNAVVTTLKTIGLYKAALVDLGKHNITCPWVDDHTKGRDNGTVYIEGRGKNLLGGFKCQHTHCLGRSTQDFIAFLEKAITE